MLLPVLEFGRHCTKTRKPKVEAIYKSPREGLSLDSPGSDNRSGA